METYNVLQRATNSQKHLWGDSLQRVYFSSSSRLLPQKSAHQIQTRSQTRLSENFRDYAGELQDLQRKQILKHNSLTKSTSCFSAYSTTSLRECNDWPAKSFY